MFVFYDTETSGMNIAFDQILQFSAVLTNDQLQEIDRIDMRSQLLPWIVPSPLALLVTSTSPFQLTDQSIPSFFDMMSLIHERIASWGTVTFIGYNSMRFDERFLQRALWQSLWPPYLTVTNGNARLDLLGIVRAISHLHSKTLTIPLREDGTQSFKLDQLAPINGFDGHKAHDAMGDVEAILFLARHIAGRLPTLWRTVVTRAPKSQAASVLSFGQPALIVEYHNRQPSVWFGQRIDEEGARASHALIANLGSDLVCPPLDPPSTAILTGTKSPLRRIALNKAPCVFTLDEAESFWDFTMSVEEITHSKFLASNAAYCASLIKAFHAVPTYAPSGGQLEDMIFDGFPSRNDEERMKAFQVADWFQRERIARLFEDARLRHLALRLIYASAPEILPAEDRARIKTGIRNRLLADDSAPHSWRSIQDASKELSLSGLEFSGKIELRSAIERWLANRRSETSSLG